MSLYRVTGWRLEPSHAPVTPAQPIKRDTRKRKLCWKQIIMGRHTPCQGVTLRRAPTQVNCPIKLTMSRLYIFVCGVANWIHNSYYHSFWRAALNPEAGGGGGGTHHKNTPLLGLCSSNISSLQRWAQVSSDKLRSTQDGQKWKINENKMKDESTFNMRMKWTTFVTSNHVLASKRPACLNSASLFINSIL